jgi:hypothetical protein
MEEKVKRYGWKWAKHTWLIGDPAKTAQPTWVFWPKAKTGEPSSMALGGGADRNSDKLAALPGQEWVLEGLPRMGISI